MDTPNYIKSLILPRNGNKPTTRRVWSIDLMQVWLPFFTATNTAGATNLPPDALGAPLRLGYNADGSVKFSKAGRPVMKVAKDISDTVRLVRDNFTANLLNYTSDVINQMPDEYKAQLEVAQSAGEPIASNDRHNLDKALALATEEAIQQAGKKTKRERVAVPA